MKQRNIKLLLSFTLLFLFANLLTSQGKDRKDMDPRVTEIWEPIPPKVDINANNVPSDATVLFDGTDLSAWVTLDDLPAMWTIGDNALTVKPGTGNIKTKESFGDMQLHLEWATPSVVQGEGQGRGNSGVLIMGRYEVQILDNYTNRTYSNGQASSIYKQTPPLVNACKAPGEWQTYDIIFKAPRFNDNGVQVIPGTVTVLHNGILTQDHTVIWGPMEHVGLPQARAHGDAPLVLQDHGNLVKYRNIWVRRL